MTTADGYTRRITADIRDDEPSLSFDGTTVVFIRKIKEEDEVFGRLVITESEIWSASCMENWRPVRLVKPPIQSIYRVLRHPKPAPDSLRVYFMVDQWTGSTGGLFYVDRATAKVSFFAPAVRFWVVPKGPFGGDLVLEQAPLSLKEGRLMIYYLFNSYGKQVNIVGLKEESVKSFLLEAEN